MVGAKRASSTANQAPRPLVQPTKCAKQNRLTLRIVAATRPARQIMFGSKISLTNDSTCRSSAPPESARSVSSSDSMESRRSGSRSAGAVASSTATTTSTWLRLASPVVPVRRTIWSNTRRLISPLVHLALKEGLVGALWSSPAEKELPPRSAASIIWGAQISHSWEVSGSPGVLMNPAQPASKAIASSASPRNSWPASSP
mmetsp:Transcript_6201/g.15805  ORF Transcript_6201/g.15805 Transcript_6201/m.15805 type:complete len:201 (+) Transcript_6201:504-1106(+)